MFAYELLAISVFFLIPAYISASPWSSVHDGRLYLFFSLSKPCVRELQTVSTPNPWHNPHILLTVIAGKS